MNDPKPWGAGRIAFVARLDAIRSELGQGLPLTVIYERHQAALGIGYASFCKLVARYAEDAKLAQRRPRSKAIPVAAGPQLPTRPSPESKAETLPVTQAEGPTHATGHAPALPAIRTFRHSPVPKTGEIDQLLGSGFLPKRGR